ncbi:MAG TPA: ABC transporter substrate-binding protein [Solirubrobacteraceae bacterium]|nr:ABC transporter substrate-binding protein [Solirubrobacteraceae bacterium]
MRKTIALALLAALAAVLLAACGEKHDQIEPVSSQADNVTMMLDWFPNADHVGIYEAMANGDMKTAGINLHVETPPSPNAPLSLLEAGKVDVAVSYEPEVMLARDHKQTIVSIAALVQQPLTSLISVGSKHITRVSQLRGKTVGTAGIPYQTAYLNTMLGHAGVPIGSVKQVNVGSNLVPAMLTGRVDATLGGYWNVEAIQLRQQHRKPNVIPVARGGVPSYDELVLVTTEKYFAEHLSLLRRLVQAIGRGYYAVRANPSQGISALESADPSLDPKLTSASVHASLHAFFPSQDKPWGWQFQTRWNAYGKWMYEHHLIKHLAASRYASTNQLLAGQGP